MSKKTYSVILRVEHVYEIEAIDEESAIKQARDKFESGKHGVVSEIQEEQADEMGDEP